MLAYLIHARLGAYIASQYGIIAIFFMHTNSYLGPVDPNHNEREG